MRRSDFVKMAVDNPKKAAKKLRAQAKKLEGSKGVTNTCKVIGESLFITERTVFSDLKH